MEESMHLATSESGDRTRGDVDARGRAWDHLAMKGADATMAKDVIVYSQPG